MTRSSRKSLLGTVALVFLTLATPTSADLLITAKSDLAASRSSETITLSAADLGPLKADAVVVKDNASGQEIVSQAIEGALIFQTDFAANQTKTFSIQAGTPAKAQAKTFARFAPERSDDYAWESDRVAFRIYGPALQKNDGPQSGVDVWCKRTHNLIVDKWYKSADYHNDHGDGCDCYKVGTGRGCGGTGVWKEGKLYLSGNFVTWKTLATGPIRAVFELTYAPWDAAGVKVSEIKRFTLDAGSNLNRIDSTFTFDGASEINVGLGLTQHAKAVVAKDQAHGWFRVWDQADKSPKSGPNGMIATGLLLDPALVAEITDFKGDHFTDTLAIVKVQSGKPVTYYAGAGWQKFEFPTVQEWDAHLAHVAQRLASPLKITVKSN